MIDVRAIQRLQEISPVGEDLVAQLINVFTDETPNIIADMKMQLAKMDFAALGKSAHSLKSSAGTLGATTLKSLSERIERLSSAYDTAELAPLLDSLEENFHNTLGELSIHARSN